MLLNRERADEIMDREGLAAIVSSAPVNTYYLSGWSTYATWGFGDMALAVLPRDHSLEPAVITPETDSAQPQQRDGTWMKIVRPYRRKPGLGPAGRPATDGMDISVMPLDHAEAVSAYLDELGLRNATVGFEDRGLGFDVASRAGADFRVKDARDLLRDIRMVKTSEEMGLMRAAARKTEIGLLASIEAIAGGATCAEAERTFWSVVPLLGGHPLFLLVTPFRPGIGRLDKKERLQPGDMVTFDSTAAFAHYTSDIGRTAVIGEPTTEVLSRWNAIRRGWTNSLSEFRAGEMSNAIERRVVKHIRAAGCSDFTGVSIHSVGLEHTDHPHPGNSLSPFMLVNGSVLSCDTPWSNPEIGRFHLEDLLYLDHNGRVETLNDPDTRLFACIDGRTVRVD